jgi:hypothetical protein
MITMIYRRLGLLKSQHFLNIWAQYNTRDVSDYHFYLIHV